LDEESISKNTFDEKTTQLKAQLNNHITIFEKQVDTLNRQLKTNINRLQNDIDQLSNSTSPGTKVKKEASSSMPKPQINIDSTDSVNIEEESLTQ
jgi:hypothetical protein